MQGRDRKMWGGRFEGKLSPEAEAYSFSLQHDQRLWKQELHACAAHARMMGITGMLSTHEANASSTRCSKSTTKLMRGVAPLWRV
jgi:argininosuccinate lyase